MCKTSVALIDLKPVSQVVNVNLEAEPALPPDSVLQVT